MAIRLNAKSVKHKEDWSLEPQDIVIDETLNGRFEPHSEADVHARAISMLVHGQLQPIGIRRLSEQDGKPGLVYGFLRTKAAKYINDVLLPKGEVEIGEGKKIAISSPFRLSAVMVQADSLESLKMNIIENLDRKSTSVMDLVQNQHRLRKAGMEDADIADLYKSTTAIVRKNSTLLGLSKQLQTHIHRGVISADAAFALLEIPEEDRADIIAEQLRLAQERGINLEHSEQSFLTHVPGDESVNPGYTIGKAKEGEAAAPAEGEGKGKKRATLSTKAIKKAVRKAKQADGKKGPALGISDLRDALSNLNVPGQDEHIREFAKKTLAYIKGDVSDTQWENAVDKLRDTTEARKTSEENVKETKGK